MPKMATASQTQPVVQSWNQFLKSSAISYVAPPPETTPASTSTSKSKPCPREYYWHQQLLKQWHDVDVDVDVDPSGNTIGVGYDESAAQQVQTISYGSYILLAAFLAEKLSRHLSLFVPPHDVSSGEIECNVDVADTYTKRVGIAIPEGPFLPLYILAVHSLNVAVGEDWVFADANTDDQNQNESIGTPPYQYQRCKGVVIIPMETDEAPERLKHILNDSSPNLILVAPGKDWESMDSAVHNTTRSSSQRMQSSSSCRRIQLGDCTQLIREALSSLHNQIQCSGSHSLIEKIWPPDIRNDSMDSLRYSHALPECFDVPRLVAVGCKRLLSSTSFSSLEGLSKRDRSTTPTLPPLSKREIMSHIVYTSGTTGRPKGCVSSLASLQHYIRAKNIAHSVDNHSRILLASAITFDPCFSDVLATCVANAVLCIAPRGRLYGHEDDESESVEHRSYRGLTKLLRQLEVTHVLCTPTLWATVEGHPPDNVPTLKVIALGGEPIPKSMVSKWARSKDESQEDEVNRQYPRLHATYGVTEACVYQTFGEVVIGDCHEEGLSCKNAENKKARIPGQSVGLPLFGTNIHICHPYPEDDENIDQENGAKLELVEQDANASEPAIGEVVLSGAQVDEMSSYLHLPELASRVFVQCSDNGAGLEKDICFYRTGDLGYIEPETKQLHILGRIKGDGMVKVNGMRIELAEIENSIVDDAPADSDEGSLVIDCMASTTNNSSMSTEDAEQQNKQLIAYCLLSAASILQLRIPSKQLRNGIIVPPGPLLALLRARCDRRVRKGCTPSFFVLIERLPLSPTGKRNRAALPRLNECSIMESSNGNGENSLWKYGKMGPVVAKKICECLNLQPCQQNLVTRDASFFALGGDSLAATRVVRGLYAQHHGVLDSRNLGGAAGVLDGVFAAKHLLQSDSLGDYVELLDSKLDSQPPSDRSENRVSINGNGESENGDLRSKSNHGEEEKKTNPLYDSLIEAITLGYTAVATSLLHLGVDPNSQPNRGRLGKVTDRKQQRALFKSNPLHIACTRGDPYLVRQLLCKGCKPNTPNASGSFPIHLVACSRLEEKADNSEEDLNRLECVKLLLDHGKTPISIKDGNKQTILHSAARSGHCELLKYIMIQWKLAAETIGIKFKSHSNTPGRIYDWHDRWFRTPVHWAILNGRTSALRILLGNGCSAFPPKPKAGVSKRTTGVIIESPLEMCLRLYGDSHGVGKEISGLLQNANY